MTGLVCPYCRTDIGVEDNPLLCEGCGSAHHADCYAENGGCTIFGCSKAPGDEPKVSVSTPELVAAAAPAAPGQRRMPPPPPGVTAPASPAPAPVDLQHVANRVVPSMFGGFAGEDQTPVIRFQSAVGLAQVVFDEGGMHRSAFEQNRLDVRAVVQRSLRNQEDALQLIRRYGCCLHACIRDDLQVFGRCGTRQAGKDGSDRH